MDMRVGVIDVGSNTTRLLVASAGPKGLDPVETQKLRLSLGEEIERHGVVSDVHVAAAAKAVAEMARAARRERVDSLDVFLTAPGRQAGNASELVGALTRAAGVQARVLTKEEEGTLAYRGAVLTAGIALPERIAVCDIGGASTEIAVGSPSSDPDWIESVDLGSVRLTARAGDMASEAEAAFAHLSRRRSKPRSSSAGVRAPRAGSWARSSARPSWRKRCRSSRRRRRARSPTVSASTARGLEILPAGVVLLAEVQRKLGVTLHVCGGGIREGAVLASLEALAA